MKKKIIKNIIYKTSFILLMSLLALSCSSPLSPKAEDNGKVAITISSSRAPTDANSNINNLTYTVTVSSTKTSFTRNSSTKVDTPVVINSIPYGEYKVSVRAEDDTFIYEGSTTVKINSEDTKDVKIEQIDIKEKGGQIALFFRGVDFDQNAKFNVSVLNGGTELRSFKDIPVTDIISGKYTIPLFLPEEGVYTVQVTGGNIDEEKYVVNKANAISIKSGKITEVDVKAAPYKTVYVANVNGSTADSGASDNPTHSLIGALNLVKDYTEPVKIVVIGKVSTSGLNLVLNQGQDITFVGQSSIDSEKGAITNSTGELITINGANVTFKNIDIFTENEGYSDVVFNSGNLTLLDNVYIKNIALKNNTYINVTSPITLGKNREMTILLDEYVEDRQVFNMSLASSFDPSFLNFGDNNFTCDNRGKLSRKRKKVGLTISHVVDGSMINKDMYYRVLLNDEEIVPYTYVGVTQEGLPTEAITVPNLKAGLSYDFEVLAKYTSSEGTDESGGAFNKVGNYKLASINRMIDATNDSNNNFEINLHGGKDGRIITQSINLATDYKEKIDYPLILTLTGSKGNVITHKITGLTTNINYLPPDTYRCEITSQSKERDYKMDEEISVVVNTEGPTQYNIKVTPKNVYYVSSKTPSTKIGTLENPFNTIGEAINGLKSNNKPITLLVKGNITQDSKINIDTPMDLTIVGEETVTAESSVVASITANNGLFNINNQYAKVEFKCINLKTPSLPEENNLFDVRSGSLTLCNIVSLETKSDPVVDAEPLRCYAKVGANGDLYIGDNIFALANGYISLDDGAKITLLSKMEKYDPLLVKLKNPILGSSILRSATRDGEVLVSMSVPSFKLQNPNYSISSKGTVVPSSYCIVDDLSDQIKKAEESHAGITSTYPLKVYVENISELEILGRMIRRFPRNSVDLSIMTNPSIQRIDKNAFNFDNKGVQSIKSLTIGEGIEVIGDSAFRNSSSLTTINLPASLTSIESNAFSIDISESPKGIPTTINIPSPEKVNVAQDAFTNRNDASEMVPNI